MVGCREIPDSTSLCGAIGMQNGPPEGTALFPLHHISYRCRAEQYQKCRTMPPPTATITDGRKDAMGLLRVCTSRRPWQNAHK